MKFIKFLKAKIRIMVLENICISYFFMLLMVKKYTFYSFDTQKIYLVFKIGFALIGLLYLIKIT